MHFLLSRSWSTKNRFKTATVQNRRASALARGRGSDRMGQTVPLIFSGVFFFGGGVRSSKSKNIVLNLVNRHSTKAFFNTQKKLNSNINTFEYLLFRMVSWRYHLFWLLLVLYLKVNAFKSEHHTSVTKKFTSWLLKIHYFKLILIQKLQDSCHLNPFLMWKNILNSICYCRSIYIHEAKNIEKSFLLF